MTEWQPNLARTFPRLYHGRSGRVGPSPLLCPRPVAGFSLARLFFGLVPSLGGLEKAGGGEALHTSKRDDRPATERFIPKDQRAPRLRGRKAVAQRARRLAGKLCEDCLAKGKRRPAEVPDHRRPLALGGSDDDSNIRCLCKACHEARTAEQFGFRRKVAIDSATGWPE